MGVPRRAIRSEVGDRVSPASEPYVADAGTPPVALRADSPVGRTGARIVHLPRIADPRGNLTVIEGTDVVPFSIRRASFWR